jgi:hypothetical protein
MSAGDFTAATLPVKIASDVAYVQVTIFSVKDKPDLLHLSVSGAAPVGEIKSASWSQAKDFSLTSWFLYTENKVFWGTAANDPLSTQQVIPLSPGGSIVQAPISASLASSTASSTATPTATPTATLVPGASPNASAVSVSTSSMATPSAASTSGDSKGGVSSGAIAGAAVGCLIAGALIAGLIFWFFWCKRKASHVRDYEASNTTLMPREKGFATNAISLGSGSSAASPMAGPLPLPLEDKAITGEISKISSSIKNHVQSYYQSGRVSSGLIDLDDIHAIGSHQPISAGTLSTLLDNPATREIALRFCIAWVVCSRIQPASDPMMSLLPVEVAGYFRMMANERGGSSGKHINVQDEVAS